MACERERIAAVTQLRSFAYSGFLEPSKADLLRYADLLEEADAILSTLSEVKEEDGSSVAGSADAPVFDAATETSETTGKERA